MPGRATAAAEESQRSCHKVATFNVLLRGVLAMLEHFEYTWWGLCKALQAAAGHGAASSPGAAAPLCEVDASPGSPQCLPNSVLPWPCRTSLLTKVKHNTFSKTHAAHSSNTEKSRRARPRTFVISFTGAAVTFLEEPTTIVLHLRTLTASMRPVCDL